MKVISCALGLLVLQHPSYLDKPTVTFDYIGQPSRVVCNQVLNKPISAGTYVAMIYLDKDQPYARAVSVALPVEPNGEQHMTVAYPYGNACPLVVQILDTNGKPLI